LANKQLHHHQDHTSYELPSPEPHHYRPVYHINDPASLAGDLERDDLQLSSNASQHSISGDVTEVNEANLDDFFESNFGGGIAQVPTLPSTSDDADSKIVMNMQFTLKHVKYPADRLARRIKIWYCSSGFALTNEIEIDQFVRMLRNSGDVVLKAFAEERFDQIRDWATLLELLRKYEQRVIMEKQQLEEESVIKGQDQDMLNNAKVISLVAEVRLPERSNVVSEMVLNEQSVDIAAYSRQVSVLLSFVLP
jgi:hypothetical protein